MPSEIDIYRSVKLLIDQHREDAPIFAAMQADKYLAAGDLDGKAVVDGVIQAIEELRNREPPDRRTNGLRAHHRLIVEICLFRTDYSREASALIASIGR